MNTTVNDEEEYEDELYDEYEDDAYGYACMYGCCSCCGCMCGICPNCYQAEHDGDCAPDEYEDVTE